MHASNRLASTLLALLGLSAAAPLAAQAQIIAFYPLATDLLDVTNTYGPMSLIGTPPPALPNNGVCLSGVYFYSQGQDIRSPLLSTLNLNDFEIDVEFNITALPANRGPILMGGNSYRWLGIYVQANGTIGIKHNNSNLAWSTSTVVTTARWYSAQLKYEQGTVGLFIDGQLALQANVGPLNFGSNQNIVTNDYSNGGAFNGCIRNLIVLNDTSLLASASAYGTGCTGSAGVPVLAGTNLPQLGTTFQLAATGLPPGNGAAFLAIGMSRTTSALGPLPFSLVPFGLAAGCDLLVSAEAMVLGLTTGGVGNFSIGVPGNPAFTGFSLFFQSASLDPGATGGIAVTNGVAASVGI